jgi:hypothetical protein
VFELGEELLDRVQIRRVFRQVEEPGADGTNGATHGVGLERTEIVHDDDVAVPQGRDQNLLDVEKEGFAVSLLAAVAPRRKCAVEAPRE